MGVIRGTPASWKKGAPDTRVIPVTAPGPLPTLLIWSPPVAVVLICVAGNVMVPPGAMGRTFGLLPLVGRDEVAEREQRARHLRTKG